MNILITTVYTSTHKQAFDVHFSGLAGTAGIPERYSLSRLLDLYFYASLDNQQKLAKH